MAEYRLTPAAERDLEVIWTYTVQQWDAEQANRYTDIMTAAFSGIGAVAQNNPGM
ncbi:type II toxin-antitoxin system RelE/ParE family toxin [Pseudomonas sp.]|uniref:type II toxin-antitoxin system RelE/ParE family toxin n=1 Tax=Pseudomonas sp. TaxID=306 RepID=UPI00338EFF5E